LPRAEKIPRTIGLTATGTSGHGSVPLADNAIAHLATAIAAVAAWKPPIRLNDTTRTYFDRLAGMSAPESAARYRAVLTPGTAQAAAAVDYFAAREPPRASMLRSSISPTIVQGGYRVNVIPSDATASLDVRLLPDEEPMAFLDMVRRVTTILRSAGTVRDLRPNGQRALDSSVSRAGIRERA
jgi:acetylornithine deacetylase/succinyl-diaminopimelate desuccinylase-like protein